MAMTVDSLYASMKALVCIVGNNQVALREMERTGGFQVSVWGEGGGRGGREGGREGGMEGGREGGREGRGGREGGGRGGREGGREGGMEGGREGGREGRGGKGGRERGGKCVGVHSCPAVIPSSSTSPCLLLHFP